MVAPPTARRLKSRRKSCRARRKPPRTSRPPRDVPSSNRLSRNARLEIARKQYISVTCVNSVKISDKTWVSIGCRSFFSKSRLSVKQAVFSSRVQKLQQTSLHSERVSALGLSIWQSHSGLHTRPPPSLHLYHVPVRLGVPNGTSSFAIVSRPQSQLTMEVWGPHDAAQPVVPQTTQKSRIFEESLFHPAPTEKSGALNSPARPI